MYIKQNITSAIGDPNPAIRQAAANCIATIATTEGFAKWPGLLSNLIKLLGNSDQNLVDGGLTALALISEDRPQKMDEDPERPLNLLIPRLVDFMSHSNQHFCEMSISTLNNFLTLMPQAMAANMDRYMQSLFTLATHKSPAIQMKVCSAFVSCTEVRLDYLLPHMENIIKYMLSVSNSTDEALSLEAFEFWTAYLQAKGTDKRLLLHYLPHLVPVLLQGMVYSDEEVDAFGGEDESKPDLASDIKPRTHSGPVAFGNTSSNAEAEDAADDDDDDDPDADDEEFGDDNWDPSDWSRRKCAAAGLDQLSNVYKLELLPFLLPRLNELLGGQDWRKREAAILALGAVAEGCFDGLAPHLGQLVPYLMRVLSDEKPLVRSITCWTLSRFMKWILKETDDAVYFQPLMSELLKRVLDNNKKVQEAACSAFATLEENAQERIIPYLSPIIKNLMFAFRQYQAKNLLILYDAIGTLAEAAGIALNRPDLISTLIPPLLYKWNDLKDTDRNIFPLLECLTSVASAIKIGFAPYAPVVFVRCLQIIEQTLAEQQLYEQTGHGGGADKEFAVCALDLLSAVTEGLGPSVEQLIGGSKALPLLLQCLSDTDNDVRQSAFALLGDFAKSCMGHLRADVAMFIGAAVPNLNPRFISVCNNATWAIGEIAVKIGPDIKPYVPTLLQSFSSIIATKGLLKSVLENTAIAIGRLALVCPDEVAPFLPGIVEAWCGVLITMREDMEKEHAFHGLCSVVQKQPAAVLGCFSVFCAAMVSWNRAPPSLAAAMAQLMASFKASLSPNGQWASAMNSCGPAVASRVQHQFQL